MLGELRAGDMVAGRYRIECFLGGGGMGHVFAARHIELGPVALKVLRTDRVPTKRDIERFRREARACARLTSEHVVRVFDVGVLKGGRPYIVMELVAGTSLETMLANGGPLAPAQAVDYTLQVCEALAEAHRLGIVHRDLKPSNLLRTQGPDGSDLVKVSDFGIAKAASVASLTLTETNEVLGSPKYMSPEQVRAAHEVDARSDLWSLGVTLYQLLCGKVPFDAFTAAGIIARIVTDPPAPVRAHASEVDAGLEAVVARCLEKAPAQRYQDVGELAFALAPFASGDGGACAKRVERILRLPASGPISSLLLEVGVPPADDDATAVPTASATTGYDGRPEPRRWKRTAALAITMLTAAFGGGIVLARNTARDGAAAPAPARAQTTVRTAGSVGEARPLPEPPSVPELPAAAPASLAIGIPPPSATTAARARVRAPTPPRASSNAAAAGAPPREPFDYGPRK